MCLPLGLQYAPSEMMDLPHSSRILPQLSSYCVDDEIARVGVAPLAGWPSPVSVGEQTLESPLHDGEEQQDGIVDVNNDAVHDVLHDDDAGNMCTTC